MTRLLLTGDTHLGKAAHLYPGRLDDQERAWSITLALAREYRCAAVLHAGDLFDMRRPAPDVLVAAERPLAEHRRLDGCRVHVIAGNHDIPSLDGACGLDVLAEAGLLTAWRRPGTAWIDGDRPEDGFAVAFLPWAPVSRLVAGLELDDRDEVYALAADAVVRAAADLAREPALPAVLVAHWSVTGAKLPSGLPVEHVREAILDRVELESQGWRAIVLAHIHRPGNVAGSPTTFYTGSPICLDHGEANVPHGVLVYDVEADTLERIELDGPAFVTAELEALADGSWAVAGAGNFDGAVVRVRGSVSPAAALGLDYAGVTASVFEAGALACDVQVTVERPERHDRDAADLDLDARALLAEWLGQHDDLTPADRDRLVELADPYLDMVRS